MNITSYNAFIYAQLFVNTVLFTRCLHYEFSIFVTKIRIVWRSLLLSQIIAKFILFCPFQSLKYKTGILMTSIQFLVLSQWNVYDNYMIIKSIMSFVRSIYHGLEPLLING